MLVFIVSKIKKKLKKQNKIELILKGALIRNIQHGYTFSKTFKDLNIPRRFGFGFKKRTWGNERLL